MLSEETVNRGQQAWSFIVGKVGRQVPLWIPSALFICKGHEFEQTNLSLARRRELLVEEVERFSPLGEERTRWSYLIHARQQQGLLFMTDAAKLQQTVADLDIAETGMFWYPGVLSLCGKTTQAEWRFLLEGNCVTAALFGPEQETPLRVISRFYRGAGSSRSWHDVYANLRQTLQQEEEPQAALYRLKESVMLEDGTSLELVHEVWNEELGDWEQQAPRTVTGDWLVTANLRDLSLLEQRKIEDANFNRYAWWVLLAIALALVLLGMLWLGVWWRQGSNHRMEALIQEQTDTVKEIERANEGLIFLRGLTSERGNVLDWLSVVNANRPEGIVFEAFQMAGDKLDIRGTARQPREVTTFREQVEKTGEFRKILLDTRGSGSEGTRFTMAMELVRAKPVWVPPVVETATAEATTEPATAEENSPEAPTVESPAEPAAAATGGES